MKKELKKYLIVLVGAVICGFAEGMFLFHTQIIAGGFTGIANILFNTVGFAPAIVVPLLNMAASLIAVRTLGLKFIILTFVTNAVYSFSIQLFATLPSITDDLLSSCILCGVIGGFGTALIMSENSTRGGSDILARFIQKKIPSIPIGKYLLVMDGMVIIAGFLIFRENQKVLYALLTLAIETSVVDIIINKMNKCNMLMIVTESEDIVRDKLFATGERGMTILEGTGAYTNNPKGVVFMAVKNREVPAVYEAVHSVDQDAFIVNLVSNEVNGEGFRIYR